jgi:hypothetical protein
MKGWQPKVQLAAHSAPNLGGGGIEFSPIVQVSAALSIMELFYNSIRYFLVNTKIKDFLFV